SKPFAKWAYCRVVYNEVHRKVYHSGGMTAFTTDYIRYVDDGLSVIVFTNIDGEYSNAETASRQVARFFNSAL
ncbi:MAG: hypothetical protein V4633_01235, partial [Pseudomonadota bacterium]